MDHLAPFLTRMIRQQGSKDGWKIISSVLKRNGEGPCFSTSNLNSEPLPSSPLWLYVSLPGRQVLMLSREPGWTIFPHFLQGYLIGNPFPSLPRSFCSQKSFTSSGWESFSSPLPSSKGSMVLPKPQVTSGGGRKHSPIPGETTLHMKQGEEPLTCEHLSSKTCSLFPRQVGGCQKSN